MSDAAVTSDIRIPLYALYGFDIICILAMPPSVSAATLNVFCKSAILSDGAKQYVETTSIIKTLNIKIQAPGIA